MSTDATVSPVPLATRLRPQRLSDVLGQPHLLGPRGALTLMVEHGHLPSLILWGPPGIGKTTISRLLADAVGRRFVGISGAGEGVSALRSIVKVIREDRGAGIHTAVFIDECHRWNRAQQDLFLPLVEDGEITLIGATTENPSYELNAALRSRCRLFRLRPLAAADMLRLIERGEAELGRRPLVQDDARAFLCDAAGGDARHLLNMLEDLAALSAPAPLSVADIKGLIADAMPAFDKGGTMYKLLLSALHKSIRGSDVDAALYWIARLVQGGAPLPVIARRLVAAALEDVGLADPDAVRHALLARETVEFMGPDGELALAHCAAMLGAAPKSTAIADALAQAHELAAASGTELPHYPPRRPPADVPNTAHAEDHFPPGIGRRVFYVPHETGYERELARRLRYWNKIREIL